MAEEYIRKSSIDYGYYPIAPILKGGSIVWKYIAFMDEINAMPPADVVKVVRCKDCKWFGKIGCAIEVVDETDMPKENDFCSFAERKTMRLIDADALWKEFCRSEAIEERYGSGVLEIAGNIIDNAPTVDAVPLVRCKDCKHFRTFRTSSDGEEIRVCVGKGIVDLNYDDFCSKAERKDNE